MAQRVIKTSDDGIRIPENCNPGPCAGCGVKIVIGPVCNLCEFCQMYYRKKKL